MELFPKINNSLRKHKLYFVIYSACQNQIKPLEIQNTFGAHQRISKIYDKIANFNWSPLLA